jgi:hypothetical protein
MPVSETEYHQRTWDPVIGNPDDASDTDHTASASLIALTKGCLENQANILANQGTVITNQAAIIALLTSIDAQLASGISVDFL